MSDVLKVPQDGRPVIIGSGVAGLMAALVMRRPCIIVAPLRPEKTSSSYLAQGGMAAAIGPGDSLEQHISDTIAAGDGLCEAESVRSILADTAGIIELLENFGVNFARDASGDYDLHREAAHHHARILHIDGDGTGRAMMKALLTKALARSHITFLQGRQLTDIATSDGRVTGVWLNDGIFIETSQCILASGGASALFPVSTNPRSNDGGPIAIALRKGARVMDLEFTQFHPTALAVGEVEGRHLLISEAVRGAGAKLVDEKGKAFTDPLQSRDIVARAVAEQERQGQRAFLDARRIFKDGFGRHYPTIYRLCRQNNIDPDRQLIPVTPASHYLMGGVQTDLTGRTNIAGLWACGEVAATGLHGANRLASNSLLEACVMAARIGRALSGLSLPITRSSVAGSRPIDRSAADIRALMGDSVGLLRDGHRLEEAYRVLSMDMDRDDHAIIGAAMAFAALNRKESRGSHFRIDAPHQQMAGRTVLSINDLTPIA